MTQYRVKEIISKSGSYFQIQWLFIWWVDKQHSCPRRPGSESYSYSTLEGAQDRIRRIKSKEPTKVKYHYE